MIPVLAAVAAGGLGLIGGERANAANANQAAAMMKFQREMASTQYQRGVADMKAAGLNPALAYQQGGAAAPSGASAQIQNTLGPAATSAVATAQAYASIAATGAQIEKTQAETAQTQLATELTRFRSQWENAMLLNASERDAALTQFQKDPNYYVMLRKMVEQELRLTTASARSAELQIPAQENAAAAANTWFGRYIAPFLGSAGQISKLLPMPGASTIINKTITPTVIKK